VRRLPSSKRIDSICPKAIPDVTKPTKRLARRDKRRKTRRCRRRVNMFGSGFNKNLFAYSPKTFQIGYII
jgi:hypothetical protein